MLACRRLDACKQAREDLIMEELRRQKTNKHAATTVGRDNGDEVEVAQTSSQHVKIATMKERIECFHLDLENIQSIRKFTEEINSCGYKVRCLVNNASVMGVPPNQMGIDRHMSINHLGTFSLSRFLMPLMAPYGRIVTVGSEAHRRSPTRLLDGQNPQRLILSPGNTWWYPLYARSKLASQLMTLELQQQLHKRGSSVKAYSVSPGRVATNIFDGIVPIWSRRAIKTIASVAFQSPKQGAEGILKACNAEYFKDQAPLYIHLGNICKPSSVAQDKLLARKLWEASSRELKFTAMEENVTFWPKV